MSAHQDVVAQLPSYAAGRLRAGERSAVEAHLRECQECSRLAGSIQAIRDAIAIGKDSMFDSHIEPARLRAMIRSGQPLDDKTASHLRVCGICSLDAAVAGPAAAPAASTVRKLSWRAAASLAAAGIVLGLLLGVAVTRMGGNAGSAVERLVYLRSLRGEAPSEPITIRPDETHVAIAFQSEPPFGDAPGQAYTIEIAPHGKDATWSTVIGRARIDELAERSGTIVLHVPAGGIPEGKAELRMLRHGETEVLLRIPFAVTR